MLKRSMLMMMAAMFLLAPAAASLAADAADLHGRWALKTVEFGGQTQDVPEGTVFAEYHADGTAKMLAQGQEPQTGTYTVQGNQLSITDSETGETDTIPFTVDGDTMVLEIEMGPGQVMKWSFERVGDVENHRAPAFMTAMLLDASEVHGLWELKSFSVNGEVVESPEAGMYTVEFYPDGTMKAYEEGELSEEGTYSVENGEITVSVEGQEPEGAAFTRDGNKLVISMEMGQGAKGEIAFERLGDAGTQ